MNCCRDDWSVAELEVPRRQQTVDSPLGVPVVLVRGK